MAEMIKVKKGLDIKLDGKAEEHILASPQTELFAIKPIDFHGLTPKLLLKAGDKVKVGTAVLYDKYNPNVMYVSPVSGVIKDVVRGERRRILEIVIESDGKMAAEDFKQSDVSKLSRDEIIAQIQKSGMWPFIKQRPYDIVAKADKTPKAIYISAYDSAPLATNYNFVLKDRQADLQSGVDVLAKLTEGKVHLSYDGTSASKVFKGIKNVESHELFGPHPVGNVGVQIHHTNPINKDEVVWVMNPQDVAALGKLFSTGKFDSQRTIAVCGSELKKTGYYTVTMGMCVEPFLKDNINTDEKIRIISGNVLTGTKIPSNGYLGAYEQQITVIPEGEEHIDVMGWANPGFNKFSVHNTLLSKLRSKKKWRLDARVNGGVRALVTSGEYEKVFPMDILPEFLLKAMIIKDIDQMEQLGIYEVAPEDYALCEVVCTSKVDSQAIVRNALDLMLEELG